jgi:hypothetical protein
VYYPQFLTYLSVKASLKDNTNVDQQKEFKIAVGDGIMTCTNDSMLSGLLPANNLFITRNTHYHIDANIKSFDISAEQDIEIHPNVVNWGQVSLPVEPHDYNLQVSQNEFAFSSTVGSVSGVIHVTTDHAGGWSATLSKSVTSHPTTLSATYSGMSSGDLRFTTNGAITPPDTIKVTAGKVTKHILIKNN